MGNGVGFDVRIGTDLENSEIARILANVHVMWLKVINVARPKLYNF